MTSDLTLPSLAPECQLAHRDGRAFTGDLAKGCILVEGDYCVPEFRYRGTDIERLGVFDLAVTRELFGGKREAFQRLIASSRFYGLCKDAGLPVDWIPVRVT